MVKTATTDLPVVRSSAPGRDPHFNHARALVQRIRDGGLAWLELADELEQLRGKYSAQGGSGRFGSPTKSANRENEAPTESVEKGWQAKVREELGLSDDMALCYIKARRGVAICDTVATLPDGETIDLDDGRSYPITAEVRAKAAALKESLLLGATPIKRALPAVEGMFVEGGRGLGGKAATNHPQNIWAGAVKLRGSLHLKHWRQGELPNGKSWDDVVDQWDAIIRQLPDELVACTAAILSKRAKK